MHHALIFNIRPTFPWRAIRPLGSHRIATFLREQGWDVEVIDHVPYWTVEELKELAKSRITKNTVFCGFSSLFSFWDEHIETFALWLKETYPDIPLVIGSSAVNAVKSEALDYYIHGFGENAILELVRSFIGNTSENGITFDPFYPDKKVIDADKAYPAYPMKSLMVKYEDRDFLRPTEWLGIEFSRGCKFKCIFCTFPIIGVKGDYTRDAEDAYIQMRDVYDRFGIKNYVCTDDTFNDRSEKIIKFADVVDRLPFQPFMSGFIRADLLVSRPQDWEHLLRLNFLGHFYGIETMNHESGKAVGKGMDPAKLMPGILEARKYFKTNGRQLYRGIISLIAGLPFETRESLNNTKNWLIDNWQEEAWTMYPLEIGFNNNAPSILASSYEKWGYRKKHSKENPDFLSITESLYSWENDYWSFEDCQDIVAQMYKDLGQYDFRFSPLNLYSVSENIEEALNHKMQMIQYSGRDEPEINDYIHKKLSL